MIYQTLLIYLNEGQESVFDEFEAVAVPMIRKYRGELILRIRPGKDSFVAGSGELPDEIHLVSFPSQLDLDAFARNEVRKGFLPLKASSVREVILFQGARIQ